MTSCSYSASVLLPCSGWFGTALLRNSAALSFIQQSHRLHVIIIIIIIVIITTNIIIVASFLDDIFVERLVDQWYEFHLFGNVCNFG